jgi:hypothetical protein
MKTLGGKEDGVAMIQVIISASLVSILSLVFASMMSNQNDAIAHLETKMTKIDITRNVQGILIDKESCLETLSPIAIPSIGSHSPLTDIKDKQGKSIYSSFSSVNKIDLGQINIKNESVSGPDSSGYIKLVIPSKRRDSTQTGQDLKSLEFDVAVSVNAANQVVSCSTGSKSVEILTGDFNGSINLSPPPGFQASDCELIVTMRDFGFNGQNKNSGFEIAYLPNLEATCIERDNHTNSPADCKYILLCK